MKHSCRLFKRTPYYGWLTQTSCREYFRPVLWTNTAQCLPEYLQQGGPKAFIVRLILAATLGASYGVNLDPNSSQSGWIKLDLDRIGVAAGQRFMVDDLFNGERYWWEGDRNYIELGGDRPQVHLFRL